MKWAGNFLMLLVAVPLLVSGLWLMFLGVHPRLWLNSSHWRDRLAVLKAGFLLIIGSIFAFCSAF